MAYHLPRLPLLAATALVQLSAPAMGGSDPARPLPPQRLAAMAALLLEHGPADADPLALEQARERVAGHPGKAWKSCLVEKEVRRLTPGSSLRITEGP